MTFHFFKPFGTCSEDLWTKLKYIYVWYSKASKNSFTEKTAVSSKYFFRLFWIWRHTRIYVYKYIRFFFRMMATSLKIFTAIVSTRSLCSYLLVLIFFPDHRSSVLQSPNIHPHMQYSPTDQVRFQTDKSQSTNQIFLPTFRIDTNHETIFKKRALSRNTLCNFLFKMINFFTREFAPYIGNNYVVARRSLTSLFSTWIKIFPDRSANENFIGFGINYTLNQ